jgi:hypothetical protein
MRGHSSSSLPIIGNFLNFAEQVLFAERNVALSVAGDSQAKVQDVHSQSALNHNPVHR